MYFEIEINNRPVKVHKGETILEVLKRIGIQMPTLCSMKDFLPTGMCRMCVVEIEGKENLIPACSFKVEEWMKIKTHSPRVVLARKTIVELLLANHPDDCLYCERNGNCELQNLAEDLHVREKRIKGKKEPFYIDKSGISIIHEPSKCILCGRCIRVCNEKIGVSTFEFSYRGDSTSVSTTLNKPINSSSCVFCGQCIMVCPTAALSERVNFSEFQVYFHDPSKKMAISYSPAVAVTIAEHFGIKANRNIDGILKAVLRKIGFDIIIDSSIGTDLMIYEIAHEFIKRLKENKNLPMFTSCCPSWIKYAEQSFPEILDNIATIKSSQQLTGTIIKRFFAKKEHIKPEDVYLVSAMPCTSRKFEATRPEMTIHGISDVDSVITTRELIRMINMYGINMENIEPETHSIDLSTSTSGAMVNISGGTTEMFLKTVYFLETGQELNTEKLSSLKTNKPIKHFELAIGKKKIKVAIINGLNNVKEIVDEIKKGKNDIHFVEVMACEGGCINGGGQPIKPTEDAIKQRIRYIYEICDKNSIRSSHQNTLLKELYDEIFGYPNNPENFGIIQTYYSKRSDLLT